MRDLVRYDHSTGKLFWKERPRDHFQSDRAWKISNTKRAGKEAFTTSDAYGYRKANIDGRLYLAHQIVWLFVHGEWPEQHIDHIDGHRANNDPSNLRQVSTLDNQRNMSRARNNTSGVTGVCFHKRSGKWMASIMVNQASVYVGLFDTIEKAAAARKAAERNYGFHENHGRIHIHRRGENKPLKQRKVAA